MGLVAAFPRGVLSKQTELIEFQIMAENQNIEYKQTWRDEYLKWVCGFANAQGGKVFIGINDKGEITGVEDYKKLMDEIPNKTVNH